MKRRSKMRDSFRSVRTTHGNLTAKSSSLARSVLPKLTTTNSSKSKSLKTSTSLCFELTEAYAKWYLFVGQQLFNAVINLMLLVIGAIFVSKGDIDSNDLLAYFLYQLFDSPGQRLIAMTQQSNKAFLVSKVYVDYGYQTVHHESSGSNPLENPKGKIEFRNVFQLSGR